MIENDTVIKSFGNEWTKFDQSKLSNEELKRVFNDYFYIFPWKKINKNSVGFDMGCGSGRWAKLVADKVGFLNCVEPSVAIKVAKKNLKQFKNIKFINSKIEHSKLKLKSQDFGYCLGVLHHLKNTQKSLNFCTSLLKKNAPFLVYIYYSFDNRNFVYYLIWRISNILRKIISLLPETLKNFTTDLVAVFLYYPLSRLSLILDFFGINSKNLPLSYYKNLSFYTMRTDSRDRFGTNLEKRFSQSEIKVMLKKSGLHNIKFSKKAPFWCAIGYKK